MSRSTSLTPVSNADFDAIEAAVMETARGRWFLAEYARRNRQADTEVLLGAIGKLEKALVGERAAQDIDRVRFDLSEMAKAIARTKAEIAAIRPSGKVQSRFEEATEALDAIVRTTERATSDILEAAEHIQEAAWTLREANADDGLCDVLDKRATDIYTACTFQDLTAQRTTRVIQVMRYLEGRINAMIDTFGRTLPEEPGSDPAEPASAMVTSLNASGLSQTDIDLVIVDQDGLYAPSPAGTDDAGTAHAHAGLPEAAVAKSAAATLAADVAIAAMPPTKSLVGNDLRFVAPVEPAATPSAPPPAGDAADGLPATPAPAPEPDRRAAFTAIDGLDDAEKLRRFT